MARVRRLIVAAAIGGLSFLPTLPSLRHADWSAVDRGWARGPVWYLMTHAEYGDYRRLRSEPERRQFIRRFWDERDPLPDTADNELEREFWRRVEVADEHFGQEVKPGWKTERGKVFIMLGPPDNFEKDRILADTWGASRWMYDLGGMPAPLRIVLQESLGVPTDRRFVKLSVRQETRGARSVSGGVAAQSSILRPTDFLPLAEIMVRRVPGPDALRNLGTLMRIPEVLDRSRSRVDVTTVFSLVPVQARIDFRPRAARADGTTGVAVTLGVRPEDLARAGVIGSRRDAALIAGYLTSVDDEKVVFPLTGAFAPDPDPDPDPAAVAGPALVFQAVSHVPPGRYLLDVSYQDTEERIMGSLRDLIDVPAFPGQGLGVSSLILSSRLERVETAPAAESPVAPDETPFMLGGYRVIPRTTQKYDPAESLVVFYEITGAGTDAGARHHFDLTYQFYIEDGGSWLPVGSPMTAADQRDAAQAWSVPLGGLPPGRYRLEVTVTDKLLDSTSVRGTLFEIVPPPAS